MGLKIDLGCGAAKKEGTIGIDIQPGAGVDHVTDLESAPLPFPDRSVSYVHSSHFIEHVADPLRVFKEINRVAEEGARLEIWLPYGWGNGGFIFTHKTFFNEDHFLHICRWYPDYWERAFECMWVLHELRFVIDPRTLSNLHRAGISLNFALRHMHNIAREFCVMISVHREPLARPEVRRTFSIGRFAEPFEMRRDDLSPAVAYDVTDEPALDDELQAQLQQAIKHFAV